jgi:hypothetical protein
MGSLCVCLCLEGGMDSQLVRAMVRGWGGGGERNNMGEGWRGPDTKNTPSRKKGDGKGDRKTWRVKF